MKETIFYQPKVGVTTRDTLRTINIKDRRYLIRAMTAILQLPQCPDIPDGFCEWFDRPNKHLPKHNALLNYRRNTPREYAQGILDKLNQNLNMGDLSPRQCEGITALMTLLAQGFYVPVIVFEESTSIQSARSRGLSVFAEIFGEK